MILGALDDFGDKPQINRISVTVRIRPLNTREIKQNPHEALRAEGSSILINEMPDDNPEVITNTAFYLVSVANQTSKEPRKTIRFRLRL